MAIDRKCYATTIVRLRRQRESEKNMIRISISLYIKHKSDILIIFLQLLFAFEWFCSFQRLRFARLKTKICVASSFFHRLLDAIFILNSPNRFPCICNMYTVYVDSSSTTHTHVMKIHLPLQGNTINVQIEPKFVSITHTQIRFFPIFLIYRVKWMRSGCVIRSQIKKI